MIVVDASVLANALADDASDGRVARAALRADIDIGAPDLVDVETTAVLRKRWLAKTLTTGRFRDAIGDLAELAIARYPILPLMARAYELRANVTAYDAAYVALAETLEATLVTADRRLANASGPRCDIQLIATGRTHGATILNLA